MAANHEDFMITQPKGPRLAVLIQTPQGDGPFPVIIMGHGLGTVKEDNISAFAAAFNKAGYATINFDYATWGASEGTPRHCIVVWDEYRDFCSVVSWARSQPGRFDSDRFIVWGSSFGGMHTTRMLAEDRKIRAGIAQCPCVNAQAATFMKPMSVNLRLGFWAIMDALGSYVGASPVYVDTAKMDTRVPGVALMMGEDVASKWGHIVAEPKNDLNLVNKVAARSVLSFPVSKPAANAKAITAPYLVVCPTTDSVAPLKAAEWVAANAQRGEMFRVPGGHFDLYPGGFAYEENLAAQLAFLKRVCPATVHGKL